MDFGEAYERYGAEIKRLSSSQYVPGNEPDDVANEMLVILWKACETYVPGRGAFGPYWWSLWLNRRNDITAAYHALKRVHGIPTEHLPELEYGMKMFPMPPETDELGRRVWGAIARGDTPKEVQTEVGISRRRYYAYIEDWRTEEVRGTLSD